MTKVKHKDIPIGIRVLITYSALLMFFYLLIGIILPVVFDMVIFSTSPYVIISNIFTLIAMTVLIVGFYGRKLWAWKLALFLYTFSILNSLLTLFYIKYNMLGLIDNFIKACFIFTLFLNIVTIWYIHERKDYFMAKTYHPHIHLADQVFISSVYIFYFFAILFILALGFEFYKSATYTVDIIADDIGGMTFREGVSFCNDMNIGDRDVCYLSVATMHNQFKGARSLCSSINSDFYKLACYQATV